MKSLVKKLFISVLLQCIYIFSYLQIRLMYEFYVWKIDGGMLWLIFVIINILVQGIVYKISKRKPLENEKHKNTYMWMNGAFIVFEVFLLTGMA